MQNSSVYSNSNERLCYLSDYVLFKILIKDYVVFVPLYVYDRSSLITL